MDHDFDPFYLKSDPPVRRMRNSLRSGQQCLVLTLVPTWDDANWDYSDGRNGWLE